jgi:LemA protein
VSSDLKIGAVIILSLLTAGAVGSLASLFNRLVQLRHNIQKAWNNIDALLLQRNEEIPKLVDLCRAYMEHEREILESLSLFRREYERAGSRAEKVAMENQISPALRELAAQAEGYPQLRANELFQKTMQRISDLENGIADRRIFFNETVVLYNIQIKRFPQRILAWGLGYRDHAYLLTPRRESP